MEMKLSEEMGLNVSKTRAIQERIENLGCFAEPQFLAPFFFDRRETIFEYLPQDTIVLLDEPDLLKKNSLEFEDLIRSEYNNCLDNDFIAPEVEKLYCLYAGLEKKFMDFHGPVILNSLKMTEKIT